MDSQRFDSLWSIATVAILAGLAASGCGGDNEPAGDSEADAEDGWVQVASSGDGVVVAAHPLAAAAGARMLEAGGNAADAAAAAAFTLGVVEPTMSGLGGRVQILLRRPGGATFAIDGTTQAPHAYVDESVPPASVGFSVIGVPGQVAGVLRMQAEHGRLTRRDVLDPAIEHARQGFVLLPRQAGRLAMLRERFLESDGARLYFLKPDGSAYEAGEVLVQTDLANTLSTIADLGAEAFYTGPLAEQIVTDMEHNGGSVTLDDLGRYEAKDSPVVHGEYRGHALIGSDRPAAGPTVIEALQILENLPVPEADEEGWASLVGQSILLALEDRASPVPPEEENTSLITSKEWAARRSRSVRVPTQAGVATGPVAPHLLGQEHTSHLSAADRDGMVVALTQSLGPSGGAAVATPGLGFLYAVTLGGYLGPMQGGQRGVSAMTPFLVLRGEEVQYVLGAAGGARIISSVVQVVSRLVDQGQGLPEALASPRFFPGVGVGPEGTPWDFERPYEAAWDGDALSALGIRSRFVPRVGAFGRVQGIAYDSREGVWQGVSDPDWEGAAAIPTGPTDTRIRTASNN